MLPTFVTDRVRFLIGWTDIYRPTWRDAGLVLLALGIYVVGVGTLQVIADALLPSAQPAAHQTEATAPTTVSITRFITLLAIVWGVSALEEYTFRNLLQKLLYTWFDHWPAIAITSIVFAGLHVPAYGGLEQPFSAVALPLTTVFVGSVILGYVYWRSANLVVPVVVHGVINTLALVVIFA